MGILNRNTVDGRARDLAGLLAGRKWGSVRKAFSVLVRAVGAEVDGNERGDDGQALADLKAAQHSAAQFVEGVRLKPESAPVGFGLTEIILILEFLPTLIDFIEKLRKQKKPESE